MPLLVGVEFKPVHPIEWCDPGDEEYAVGDAVIAQGATGLLFGFVKTKPRVLPEQEIVETPPVLLRIADRGDWAQRERMEARKADGLRICRAHVQALRLPMKLLECEWTLDGVQATFHFVAEGRIDFRELVRLTAVSLRARILMRQVGARDEAKVYPGIGPCGRPTCCSTFLREFAPVSIRMAKDHSVALNPAKFTGLCGKLMCCLRYESDEALPGTQSLPQPGMVVMTPFSRAKVEEVDALRQMVTVQLESGRFAEVRLKDISEVPNCVDHDEGDCAGCAIAAAIRPATE